MATDNAQANASTTLGAIFRTLGDAAGTEWAASVMSYAVSVAPGNNVLQVVTAANGLPVAQQGAWSVAIGAALPAGAALIGGIQLVDAGGSNKVSISSAGALLVDGSSVVQSVQDLNLELPQGSTSSGQVGPLIQGSVSSAAPTYTTGQIDPLSLTTAGALRVDASATTQPISGTITANAGSGTFTVLDLADGSVAPGASATKSTLIGGQFNTAAPTLTSGQQVAMQLDASGNLNVNVKAGGGAGGTSSNFNSAFPTPGTAVGGSDGTNMKPLLMDGSGFLKVNVSAGSAGNAAASLTGSAIPVDADYVGLNVAGNLRGQTGVNPSGTVYAAQTDLSSVGGTAIVLGQAIMGSCLPVVISSNQSAVPVSGTVTANAGTGTRTVAGTVTANIGTTNGLSLDSSVNGILVAQASFTAGQSGPLMQGAVLTGAPTYTTAKTSPLTLTTVGALRVDNSAVTQPVSGTVSVNVLTGANTIGNVTVSDPAVIAGTITVVDAGSSTSSGASGQTRISGTPTAGSFVSATLSGQSSISWEIAGTWSATLQFEKSMDGGVTWFTVSGLIVASTSNPTSTSTTNGTFHANVGAMTNFRIRCTAFTSGTATIKIQPGNGVGNVPVSIVPGATLASQLLDSGGTNKASISAGGALMVDGSGVSQPVIGTVTPGAAATGGATPYQLVSAATTNATSLKVLPGQVYSVQIFNTNTAARYLKFFDKASAPVLGTDTPIKTLMMPGNTSGTGATITFPVGIEFLTGIAFAIVANIAASDATAVGLNDCVVNIDYN